MSVVDYLNENEHRAYPFKDNPSPIAALPEDAIVEVGFILGPGAAFQESEHFVWLASIVHMAPSSSFRFSFRCNAPGLDDEWLRIDVPIDAGEFSRFEQSLGTALEDTSSSLACPGVPDWEGYLICGDLAALLASLPSGNLRSFELDDWVVEQARVHGLGETFARSLNFANGSRSHATAPAGCSVEIPNDASPYPAARCRVGDVFLAEGFNATISQRASSNAVILSAAPGGGAGEPCAEVPVFDGEEPPEGSNLLSGGPSCAEVLQTINGLQGPVVRFVPGLGVRIEPGPRENELTIAADLHGLAVCPVIEEVSSSLSEPDASSYSFPEAGTDSSSAPAPETSEESAGEPASSSSSAAGEEAPPEEPPPEEPPAEAPSSSSSSSSEAGEEPPPEEPPAEESSSSSAAEEEEPPGGIQRTSLGTATTGGVAQLSISIPNVTLATDDLLVVEVGLAIAFITPTVTWNGNALTQDVTGNTGDFAVSGFIYRFKVVTGGTGSITVTMGSSLNGITMAAKKITGLTSGTVDRTKSAAGSGTTPSAGATLDTTQADEYIQGAVFCAAGNSSDNDGSWSNSFFEGQNAYGSEAGSSVTLCEGYKVVAATGPQTAAKTGITSRSWLALCATYK